MPSRARGTASWRNRCSWFRSSNDKSGEWEGGGSVAVALQGVVPVSAVGAERGRQGQGARAGGRQKPGSRQSVGAPRRPSGQRSDHRCVAVPPRRNTEAFKAATNRPYALHCRRWRRLGLAGTSRELASKTRGDVPAGRGNVRRDVPALPDIGTGLAHMLKRASGTNYRSDSRRADRLS
jgi:hypothetical protein